MKRIILNAQVPQAHEGDSVVVFEKYNTKQEWEKVKLNVTTKLPNDSMVKLLKLTGLESIKKSFIHKISIAKEQNMPLTLENYNLRCDGTNYLP